MAIMHPDWKTIANLHQRATEGERKEQEKLRKLLIENLEGIRPFSVKVIDK